MTLDQAILEALGQSELPLKAAEIIRIIKPVVGRVATPKAVAAALEAKCAAGALHLISGTKPLFTPHSPTAAATALLRHFVQVSKKEQPAAKLKSRLPTALHPCFEPALALLASQGAAFVLPGSRRLVFARRPPPSALLSPAQRRTLQKTFDVVNSLRVCPATLDAFIAWLDEESSAAPSSSSSSSIDSSPCTPGEAELRAWYDADRIRSSTVMIPIPRTFARYQAWAAERGGMADSQVLRNLLEGLYNNGLLLLEPCERPQDLPDDERALLVPMSLGPPGYSWCWIS
ncbi:hypothetical protein [Prosthecobacter sp.]|uniref:hypothetical protein n=1 Tax=Prosthecobacter sp. TaxID=1965333 RepID=UPI0037830B59